jgi:hypothetical protein
VPVEADVVTPLLSRGHRAVAVNDCRVEQIVLRKRQHRAGEDRVDTGLCPTIDEIAIDNALAAALLEELQAAATNPECV